MLHRNDKEAQALVAELAALPVFAGLDQRCLAALAGCGRVVHLPAGWALVSEDTPADSCYVLLSGDTEVRHGNDVLADLHPGALVGEAALVERRRRNATVVTTTAVRALRLGFDDLTALFAKNPALEQVFRTEWDRKAAPA